MIIVIKDEFVDSCALEDLCSFYKTRPTKVEDEVLVLTSGSINRLEDRFRHLTKRVHVTNGDIQLADIGWRGHRTVRVGRMAFGGGSVPIVAGPCSIESEEQIVTVADFVASRGIRFLRAGCFKPRTSPYSFQGLGMEGLQLLRSVADVRGLKIVTEVRDATHIDAVIELADVVQIGAKAMYDHGVLCACGEATRPVLLKRHFGATLQEFVQAAEFVLSRGNPNVMLCERGIRTFETKTRFTLDLCGVAFLKQHTNLPVIVDPSHAMGYRYGVSDLARASLAMGIDGLLIEVHPTPDKAKSDAAQQLDFEQFAQLHDSLNALAGPCGVTLT